MASGAMVARTIRLFRDQTLSPAALSGVLATVARQKRDELIASGNAPPAYQTFVDGREGAPEESVRPDGAILYRFNLLGQAVAFALTYCLARSPVESGAYRRAWFVAVDGRRWDGDLNDIPAGSEVLVTNPMPYARKIDVGGMRMKMPPQIVEGARQQVMHKFPTLSAQRTMVTLPSDVAPAGVEVPYILRGHSRSRAKRYAARRLLAGTDTIAVSRKDTAKGQQMTYPALVIRTK